MNGNAPWETASATVASNTTQSSDRRQRRIAMGRRGQRPCRPRPAATEYKTRGNNDEGDPGDGQAAATESKDSGDTGYVTSHRVWH